MLQEKSRTFSSSNSSSEYYNAQKKARCCHQAFLALFLTDEKGSNDLLASTLNSPSANVVVLVPL